MSRKKQTIDEIVDDLVIEQPKEDSISEANKEIFVPNEKKYRIKKIIIICLLILIIGLIVLYIIQSKEHINEVKIAEQKINTSLTMNKLAKVLPTDGEYTITLKANNIKLDSSKIKWSVEDKSIVSLNNCSKLICNITGKNIGETTLKAYYDKDNYAEMKIKVVDNQMIYIFQEKNYEGDNYIWASYDLTDIEEKPSYKYECKSIECSYLSISNNNILIQEDDEYYYLDINTNTKKILDYDLSNYEFIEMVEGANKKVIGLILDYNNYYSISKKDIIISSSNEDDYLLSGCGLINYNKIILANSIEDKTTIYSLDDGSLLKEFNKYLYYFDKITIADESYFVVDSNAEKREFIIMNDNFNVLMDDIYDYSYSNKYLYVITNLNDTVVDKYDVNLNYVGSSNEYLRVYDFFGDYVTAVNAENELILIDLDDNVIYKFTTLTKSMGLDSIFSSYQDEDNQSGIYVYVEDEKKNCDDEGCLNISSYYYNPETGEGGEVNIDGGTDIE